MGFQRAFDRLARRKKKKEETSTAKLDLQFPSLSLQITQALDGNFPILKRIPAVSGGWRPKKTENPPPTSVHRLSVMSVVN